MIMDKYDYEERYGEKVIYCRVHRMSGIDGCEICEQEMEETAYYLSQCCKSEALENTLDIDDRHGTIGKCNKCFEDVDFEKYYREDY